MAASAALQGWYERSTTSSPHVPRAAPGWLALLCGSTSKQSMPGQDHVVRKLIRQHLLEAAELRVPVQVEVVGARRVPLVGDRLLELRRPEPDIVVILLVRHRHLLLQVDRL